MRWVRLAIVCVPFLMLVVAVTPAAANPTSNSAGYTASTTAVSFTSATDRVQIPKLTCPATGTYSPQVTFGWKSSNPSTIAALVAYSKCIDGANTAQVLTSLGGGFTNELAASPGDLIYGHFTYDPATGVIRFVVRNLTTAQKFVYGSIQPGLTWNDAVYLFYPDGPCIPFTPIQFGSLTIDGKPLATTLAMSGVDLSQCNRIAAVTSPFNAAGKGFHVRYQPA